ncbi:patatin-like phospholipase family protein [Alteribacillus sp. YIM 98480]|uniref:patatin-like phospholipase family protein n=1 Tax=Alteribacillus sp. YIM 98480 TaxID=2606599 RepID=UPI00131BA565|nr:patatin-like phospholipase family protein [Alteribacillus sp. YIM 98480]
MKPERPSIGLALGAGGVRGYAHIGVLEKLQENNIPVDLIAGSSMGALVASLYGAGHEPDTLEKFARLFKRKYYLDFNVPKMGLVQGQRVKDLIYMLSKKMNIEDMRLPVGIVATDLTSGEAIVFRDGCAADAVRASISIPGIFVPQNYRGRMLVDGGVADRVPASTARSMGADLTIAVDVSFYNKEPVIGSIYDVIMQSMDIMGKQLIKYREVDADVLIKPISSYYNAVVFENVDELIEAGRETAENYIPEILEKINKWKEIEHGKE